MISYLDNDVTLIPIYLFLSLLILPCDIKGSSIFYLHTVSTSVKVLFLSTYQCSVCCYVSDLNLEVIEKFQTNKSVSYRFPLWYSQPENSVPFAPENFRKFTPELLVQWKTPQVSHDTSEEHLQRKKNICIRLVCEISKEWKQRVVGREERSLLRVLCLAFVHKPYFPDESWHRSILFVAFSVMPKLSHKLQIV